MKPGAATYIYCPTADGGWWAASGQDRAAAEHRYGQGIVDDVVRPPLYRVVAQLKVDQHDGEPPSLAIH